MAAITGGALADAQSQAPPQAPDPHLLVVPATAEGESALAGTDARVVARYGAFSLVEAAGADDQRLREAGADRRDDMRTVRTAAGKLDPRSERRPLAGKAAPARDEVLAIVQFVGPPKDAWLERLGSTGARIVTYQAENAYVVHANGDEVDRLAALVGSYAPVRTVAVLTAADKLENPGSATGRYAVQTVSGAEGGEAREDASAAGPQVGRAVGLGQLRTQYLALSEAEAAELARDPAVVAVEPYAEPALADERGAQIVAGNLTAGFAPNGSNYLDWLVDPLRIPDESTFDFAVDVTDEGLDGGANPPAHSDFRALGLGSGASRLAYLNNYSSDGGATAVRDCGGHGTNVASIAAGYNAAAGPLVEDGLGYNHGLGVAPFAKLGASKIFNCAGGVGTGWTPANLASNAYAATARISNNSWGTGGLSSWSDYSARSREYDAVVRDARPSEPGNQPMVEVFAAGNDGEGNSGANNEGYGTLLAESTAKNVISVGAAEGVHPSGTDGCQVPNSSANSARDIVDFASRGPTDDGRLKPDLVAPGTHMTGARPRHAGYTGSGACTALFGGSSAFYSLISGSSQAAPQVAGAAALVRHWYMRTRGAEPTPALTKALLINTATDLAGGQSGKGDTIAAGPNTDQGWGRVNVGNALRSTEREYRDQLPGDVLGASGASVLGSYAVDDPGAQVKVTLAWTDAPGPITGNSFVNDLDLQVEAGGRTYKGNVLAGAVSRPGGSSDTRNNVESVYLPAGITGSFAVKVVGANIPGDGIPGNADPTDQDFALVVSNANEEAAPVLVHDLTTIDDSVAGGDGDGALEPGESFSLNERLRNAGAAGATNLSGTLSGSADVSVTQGDSAWPNLAAGDTGTNVAPLAGSIPGGTVCGTDAAAALGLTSDEGAHDVPLALPTGAEGDLVSRSPVPPAPALAIPDDSAAGVSSTITVGTSGRVKDLDVRVNVDHDWVGDLRIDLIAPDGTIVNLVEHAGGPDNFAKDLTNIVFDDEAPTSIATATAPYSGRYRPQNDQLARLDGKQQSGVWTLRVRDLFEGDTGSLVSWGTDTYPAVCAVTTAPPTPPQTTIGPGPAEGSVVGSGNASFGFSSSVGGSSFECRIDGGGWGACTSPKGYTGLVDGTHTFAVRAVSGGLKDPTPAIRTWTSDTTRPNTTITGGPAEGQRVGSGAASFEFVSPDTPNATFECRVDGGSYSTCSEPHAVNVVGDGPHTFAVRAWDQVGNIDATPAERTWILDTTAPLPTVEKPAGATEDSQPTISGTAGTAPGDSSSLTVRLYQGDPPAGSPLHTMAASVAADGSWSVEVPAPLTLGAHSAEVEQSDTSGNVTTSPPRGFEIVADFAPPIVSLTAPANGSITPDPRPTVAGVAGILDGDDGTVTVELWNGTLAGGVPAQTLVVPRDGASGAFAAVPAALAEGTYTVRARQGDSALPSRNTGQSQLVTFTVDLPDPPVLPPGKPPAKAPPSFVLAPSEERLADALANRYAVLAACDSACKVNARLTVSAGAARKLGMKARAVAIGNGEKRLPRAGAAAVRVGLTAAARKALRGRASSSATLNVIVRDADGTSLALKRTVTLRSSAGLKRIVRGGMSLWSVCSGRCTLRGALRISAASARKLGMKPKSGSRLTIASGRATSGKSPKKLTLKVSSAAAKALGGAKRLSAVLEASTGSASTGLRSASRSLTLR